MPVSSSESWSARVTRFARNRSQTPTIDASTASGGQPADIIDLDRFMRSGVKPNNQLQSDEDDHFRTREIRRESHRMPESYRSAQAHSKPRESLVVDAGAISRKLSSGKSAARVRKPSSSSDTSVSKEVPVETRSTKRFSHDSGLSDASYTKRKHHRVPKRASGTAPAGKERDVDGLRDRKHGSTASLKAFRAACEQALKQQQEQIARVAQICERLTQVAPTNTGPTTAPPTAPPVHPAPPASASAPTVPPRLHPRRTVMSSVSSDSSTTTDPKRKDKHRTEQCKTYKIIMNKLDELNRLFVTRAPHTRVPLHAPHRPYVFRSHRSHSHSTRSVSASASISVSDKVISTTDPRRRCKTVKLQSRGSPVCRADGGGGEGRGRVVCLHMTDPRRFTTHSSHAQYDRLHLECSCSKEGVRLSNQDNLDSIRVYSSTRRTSGAGSCAINERRPPEPGLRFQTNVPESLCTMCRVYFRSLKNCLANQFLCRPDLASVAN